MQRKPRFRFIKCFLLLVPFVVKCSGGQVDSGTAGSIRPTFGTSVDGIQSISTVINPPTATYLDTLGRTRSFHSSARITGIDGYRTTLSFSGSVSSQDFTANDEVMWIVIAASPSSRCTTQGAVGSYGFATIRYTGSSSVTIDSALPSGVNPDSGNWGSNFCMVELIRVPNFMILGISPSGGYGNVPFNSGTGRGGVVVMRISDTIGVAAAATFDVSQSGFGGNTGNYQGDGNRGPGTVGVATANANGGGASAGAGGGGGANAGNGGGGGGGTQGGTSNSYCSGICSPDQKIFLGGGGGSTAGSGGIGGGIIMIFARKLVGGGAISVNASAGSASTNGAGGGAGGSIYIVTGDASGFTGGAILAADGGAGGNIGNGGGGGSGGLIAIRYCNAGTTLYAVGGGIGFAGGANGGIGSTSNTFWAVACQ